MVQVGQGAQPEVAGGAVTHLLEHLDAALSSDVLFSLLLLVVMLLSLLVMRRKERT